MFIDDADYFTRRALSELRRAAASHDDQVAQVHLQLSDLLLERARSIVADMVGTRRRAAEPRALPLLVLV